MNIWAINKDLNIKHFLVELVHRFGENTFSLIEHPDQYQAVEIFLGKDAALSMYIYTFAQTPGTYGIDIKYPLSEHNMIGENENLSIEQVFSILSVHFEL